MKSQVLASLAVLSAFAGCTWAQTAGLSGSVTDPSLAPIPKATVTITAPSTGFTRTAQTNETGLYTFTYLQPGVYDVTVTAPGLSTQVKEGVRLEVAQTVRIDSVMHVGATQQLVTVNASADLIQPETSDIGQVISECSVNELPLNGRNPLSLVALVPGVVPQGESQQNAAGTKQDGTAISRIYVIRIGI